jgi:hypothetical protein
LLGELKLDKGKGSDMICQQFTFVSTVSCSDIVCLLGFSEDEQFEADKAQVMKEVAALEPKE